MNNQTDQRVTDQGVPAARRLNALGTIVVTGSDAQSFLQGQLSFDMSRLTPDYVEVASINSAQGRVQAVAWLLQRHDAIVMILPATMIDTVIGRLRKFVLRAKVNIDSGHGQLSVGSVDSSTMPQPTRGHLERDGLSLIHWPTGSGLVLAPAHMPMQADASNSDAWRLENIRAGLPAVYPQTHEAFIAQMLNLDLLQGISFEKGCYTGQEIIARMHFRGQVKRRMLRFAFAGHAPAPGARVVSEGNHAGDIVDAAATSSGSELLAVINLTQADTPLAIDGEPGQLLQRLPLPYEVKG